MKWSERATRTVIQLFTILMIPVSGVALYVEKPWAWPGFILGIPAGLLVGRWIKSELTLARIVAGIAISLMIAVYSTQTSGLACIPYISIMFFTVLPSISFQGQAVTLDQGRRFCYLTSFSMPVILLQVVWKIVNSLLDKGILPADNSLLNFIFGSTLWFISAMGLKEAKRKSAVSQNTEPKEQGASNELA